MEYTGQKPEEENEPTDWAFNVNARGEEHDSSSDYGLEDDKSRDDKSRDDRAGMKDPVHK